MPTSTSSWTVQPCSTALCPSRDAPPQAARVRAAWGRGVSVGHNAVVHGCTVEDDVLVGMGAVVLDGAVIGEGSLVGAGALVTGGTVVPPRSLVLGSPARVVRTLTDVEVARTRANAAHYVRMSRMYLGTRRADRRTRSTRTGATIGTPKRTGVWR